MAFDAAAFDALHDAPRHAPSGDPDAGDDLEYDLGDDPIVEEVRAARRELFAQAGDNLEEFGRQIRASEAAEGLTSVTWPPRAP